jgi:type II secretory pathway component PulC
MKNSAIFIIVLIFLAMTLFFWFQVLKIKDLPPAKRLATGGITGAQAEAFIKLAEELLIDYREPLRNLSRRDPFVKWKPSSAPEIQVETRDKFVLSSVIYSDLHALAVVNGEILAEGDTIPGYKFMIENIEVDKVEISDGQKKYTLGVTGVSDQ